MSNQITYEIACYSYISNTVSKIYKCLTEKFIEAVISIFMKRKMRKKNVLYACI